MSEITIWETVLSEQRIKNAINAHKNHEGRKYQTCFELSSNTNWDYMHVKSGYNVYIKTMKNGYVSMKTSKEQHNIIEFHEYEV